jgi:hypothetical protein
VEDSKAAVEHEWHEAASVTITRLVCAFVLAMVVVLGAGTIMLAHPEYASVSTAFIGVAIGASFGFSRNETQLLRRAARRQE